MRPRRQGLRPAPASLLQDASSQRGSPPGLPLSCCLFLPKLSCSWSTCALTAPGFKSLQPGSAASSHNVPSSQAGCGCRARAARERRGRAWRISSSAARPARSSVRGRSARRPQATGGPAGRAPVLRGASKTTMTRRRSVTRGPARGPVQHTGLLRAPMRADAGPWSCGLLICPLALRAPRSMVPPGRRSGAAARGLLRALTCSLRGGPHGRPQRVVRTARMCRFDTFHRQPSLGGLPRCACGCAMPWICTVWHMGDVGVD